MTKPPLESVTLYFKDGSSDKVYQASIEAAEDGELFVVNFAYGRRGSTMTTGTKTQSPVSRDQAQKVYEKAVKEKTAKGYTVGESGTPYQFTDKESRDSGIHPQLLNAVDEGELERLLKDDSYCMQEKFDGKRIMIRKIGDVVEGINRLGLTVGLPKSIQDDASFLQGDFILDGECVGDNYFVFDLLSLEGVSMEKHQYQDRWSQLIRLAGPVATPFSDSIRPVNPAVNEKSKRRMLEDLRSRNAEGVVFKRLDAPYVAGRPASGGTQLKFKFVETASCLVAKVNAKRSIALELFHSEEDLPAMQLIGVGNCTVPPNYDLPKPGDVVEIRYLYAYKGGSLYQPVYQGVREDILPEACLLSQLKYKNEPGSKEEDES